MQGDDVEVNVYAGGRFTLVAVVGGRKEAREGVNSQLVGCTR